MLPRGIQLLITLVAPALALSGASWKDTWGGMLAPPETLATLPAASVDDAAPAAPVAVPAVAPEEPVAAPPVEAFVVTPDAVLQAIRDDLIGRFQIDEGELVVIPAHPVTRHEVPSPAWFVELVPPFPAVLNGRLNLRYRLTDGLNPTAPEAVSIRLEWWRDAYVAHRLVRPGEGLGEGAAAIQSVNWLQHRGDLVGTGTLLEDLRLKSAWRPGEPLRWAMAESRPLIEEGAVVEVVAERGKLRVSMRGVATQSGHAGDLISVRNLLSRKEVQGIVSDENTVLVVF